MQRSGVYIPGAAEAKERAGLGRLRKSREAVLLEPSDHGKEGESRSKKSPGPGQVGFCQPW